MFESIILNIKKERFLKYSEAFDFFQSKSINMITNSRKVDYVVHFRDLEFYDDETQYFKRYYSTAETMTRVKKLINYYENNMTPPTPNLLTIENYHIIQTRNRKLLKLCIMKEKSQERRAAYNRSGSTANMILSQVNDSNLSLPSSDMEIQSQQDSYDSDPHCAFEDEEFDARESNLYSTNRKKEEIEPINLHTIDENQFIFDFKGSSHKHEPVEEPPIQINVIAPKSIKEEFKKPKTTQFSISCQTEQPQKKKLQRSKQISLVINTKRQTIPPLPNSSIQNATSPPKTLLQKNDKRSQNSEKSLQKKQEKKKPTTFMEYYNSIPVKNPSNILEKYLKRKK